MLLIAVTPLELTPYRIIYGLIGFGLVGLPLLNWMKKRTHRTGISALILSLISIASVSYFSTALDWRGPWKTQTIQYRHLHLSHRTIEFQMQDKGARGYNRRTVDRIRLLPFLSWTRETSTTEIDLLTWKLVKEDVNELGLKGP